MKKITYYAAAPIFGASLISASVSWGAGNDVLEERIGIERISADARHYSFKREVPATNGPAVSVYHFGVYNQNINEGPFRSVALNEYPQSADQGFGSRTITKDIRQTLIDKDRFEAFLAEDNYADALQMIHANPQGNLWKQKLVAQAKKNIVRLVEQGVFRERPDLLNESLAIVNFFQTTDAYQTLITTRNETLNAATTERTTFQAPVGTPLGNSLRSEMIRRLFARS